ncbi:acyl-coenzyme A synthetase/AMP-(fatty) acid ligase/thioesterase domain-containing protein [Kineosphaera limosa]|uniref:Putative non-ribosomal peptide synthetase n=1 Tax=Kineosphaera limosa NBRC 100340 TaxID=1184609 RepID=K6VIZ6_9MICO|nr:non-ribosomal peptide synthetase [Kineosphaera limosa]NYE03274.1 acyl-coenzyme A synthetase/AMP-(fatty) acid ligase/thioesterase domain-containing protein [Kineosphaera limosa]GAB96203.1 putative non-ribosomal peptide synthetase [Kineosphaera limosa NBRC 100340]
MSVSPSTAPASAGDPGPTNVHLRHGRRFAELTEDEVAAGILPRLRTVVESIGDRVAVSDEVEDLTFAQLAQRSAAALAGLRRAAADLPADQPVGMLYGHTVGAVATLVAVLASGHPVLVLDPRSPAPRLRTLVERSGVTLICADEANEALAADLGATVTVPLRDADESTPVDLLWQNPPEPTQVAALAFTSGSTGQPKPVANDHRLFVRDAWNSSIATGCYDSTGVIAHTLPIAFHAGLTTTIHGLLVGACMRLYDSRSRGIANLPAFIAEYGCTVMITSPAILRAFCSSQPDRAALRSLTSVTIAGEAAYGRDADALRPLLPPTCVLRNRYGSSETGLISEYVITPDAPAIDGPLPVGRGVGRTVIDLVATTAAGGIEVSVEPGATGQITVTAPDVALGYWGMPNETGDSFRDNPDGTRTYRTSDLGRFLPDSSMQLVGRADHSVKVRGYLVDPAEVDAALFALPAVREAVVVGVPRQTGGTRLVAYIVGTDGPPDAGALRAELRRALPAHMVPEGLVFLEALPRSERGKIDRAALPEPPAAARVEEDGSLSYFEQLVAMIWAQVLDVDHVGADDDFFALGGDSLATEELMTRISQELNIPSERVHSGVLAQAPVLRDFAATLQESGSGVNGALVPLNTEGDKEPLFIMAGAGGLGIAFVGLSRRLGKDRPAYALQSPVIEGRGWPERSVRQMAADNIERLRQVQPQGPYHLAGHSFGGILAFEMAHQLRDAGHEVALLALLDSFPPDPELHPAPEGSALLRARRRLMLHYTTLRSTPGGSGNGRLFEQSKALAKRYRGRPYPGKSIVFLAQSPEKEQRDNWDRYLCGQWERIEVTGDHYTMIRPPWVYEVADVLARELEAAELSPQE